MGEEVSFELKHIDHLINSRLYQQLLLMKIGVHTQQQQQKVSF
jgi:hypothetical protein